MSYPIFGKLRFPSLKSAPKRSFNLSDIKVSIELNSVLTKWGEQQNFPDNINVFDQEQYQHDGDSIGYHSYFRTRWDIKGRVLRQSEKSHIYVNLAIAKGSKDLNFFIPEQLGETITSENQKRFDDDSYYLNVTALREFQQVSINDTDYLFYVNDIEYCATADSQDYVWITPITENHYLQFTFGVTNNTEVRDHLETIKDYCTSIMQTVHIDFPEWVKKEKATTVSVLKDTYQIAAMEPLVWKREADTGSYLDFRREAAKKAKRTEEQK
jgi:hypothetical protein